VRASAFFQNINPDLSPRREDAKKSIEWGGSSRLCGFAREIMPA
jgi:hypothetical protein